MKRWVLVGAVLGFVALVVVVAWPRSNADDAPLDPFPDSPHRITAVGDSYISGEGARRFFAGTNVFGVNECRRASTAFPWVVADRLEYGLSFAACSGARIEHLLETGQYPDSPADTIGGRPQLDVLVDSPRAEVVLVSIGGNDAGFAEVGYTCATEDCLPNVDRWMGRITGLRGPLQAAYEEVRQAAGGATVFAFTYPNPLGADDCLPGFTGEEWNFLRNQFVPYLDDTIVAAARAAGVNVLDVRDVFDGVRICEVDPDAGAMNIVSIGRVEGMRFNVRQLFHNTLHPNRRGHSLIAGIVADAVARITGNPAPVFASEEPGPWEIEPAEEPPPSGLLAFPAGTPCQGDRVDFVFEAGVADTGRLELEITGAAPRSTICHRSASAAWQSATTDGNGDAVVEVDVERRDDAAAAEVLYVDPEGRWTRVVLTPTA